MIKLSKGRKFSLANLTFFVGVLVVWLPKDAEGAPVVQLTSPDRATVVVPEGTGLLIEVEISDDSLPDSPENSSVSWSVLEAPDGGTVTFSPPHGPATVASFNLPGFYRILISATNDGVNTGTEELAVYTGILPNKNPGPLDAIVHFAMDEGKGIRTSERRGGNSNGRLVNGADWTGPNGGISGTGILLDGIDDEINFEIEIENDTHLSKERTISLWFKADDPLRETKQVLYQENGIKFRGFNVYLEAGKLYVGGWTDETGLTGGNVLQEIFLSTELVDTNWHHVGLILKDDPRRLHIGFKAFLDGEEFPNGGGNTFREDFNYWYFQISFSMGSNGGAARYHDGVVMEPGDHFAGIVDEFQLWNRGLDPDEVRELSTIENFLEFPVGPELTLSSVDHSAGSVVIPPGMGIVLDGDTPGNGSLETEWETVIAPQGGEVRFDNPAHPSTLATFSNPGYYKLRLSADYNRQKSALDVDAHAGLEAGSNFPSPREVVYLSMDEGSGDTAGNAADGSRPGILSNPSGWTSEGGGISGTAIQLDGIGDYIEVNTGNPIQYPVEKISLALWMKPNETGTGEKEIVFQLGDSSAGINTYLDGDLLYFGSWNEGDSSRGTFLAVPITRGRWHHVALVFDPDSSGFYEDGLRGYLNGRQVASGRAASGMDSRMDQSTLGAQLQGSHFHDGMAEEGLRYAFSGILDEFHFYQDHSLTIDEIGMLYAFGNVGPTVDTSPDQVVVLPSSTVLLEGISTDDGRWESPVTYSWHILDGPGTGRLQPLGENSAFADFGRLILGSYRIALGAYDGQVTTFDELMVTVRQPTPFERYMQGFPAIAVEDRTYHADPDGDNWSNLVEYALGGAPDVGETYYQLGLKHELVMEAGFLYPEFRYPRRRDAAQRGLRYEFQVSDDLSTDSWTTRGYYVLEVIPIDEIFEEVRLTIRDPVDSANSRIFGRVRVIIDE